MPIFEYRCSTCGQTFERYEASRLAGKDESLACPKCGRGRGERIFSAFSAAGCGGPASGASSGGCGHGHGGFS